VAPGQATGFTVFPLTFPIPFSPSFRCRPGPPPPSPVETTSHPLHFPIVFAQRFSPPGRSSQTCAPPSFSRCNASLHIHPPLSKAETFPPFSAKSIDGGPTSYQPCFSSRRQVFFFFFSQGTPMSKRSFFRVSLGVLMPQSFPWECAAVINDNLASPLWTPRASVHPLSPSLRAARCSTPPWWAVPPLNLYRRFSCSLPFFDEMLGGSVFPIFDVFFSWTVLFLGNQRLSADRISLNISFSLYGGFFVAGFFSPPLQKKRAPWETLRPDSAPSPLSERRLTLVPPSWSSLRPWGVNFAGVQPLSLILVHLL